MARDDARLPHLFGWALVALLVAAELYRRVAAGAVPPDFSAYLAAADVWMQGGDPYGPALLEAPRYGGYPYVYVPGTLSLIAPLHELSTEVATSLELVVRVAVLFGIVLWCRRTWELEPPLFALLPLALFYEPIAADFLGGNLTTYMLGVVLACREIGRRPSESWHAMAGVPLGLLLAFKPMWILPVGAIVLVERAWRLVGGLLVGGSTVIGLTLWQWPLVDSWLRRIEQVRAHYQSIDLLSLGRWLQADLGPSIPPATWPAIATLVWAAIGWGLWRRVEEAGSPSGSFDNDSSPDTTSTSPSESPKSRSVPLWLWGCASLMAWPRLGSYSYVLWLPVLTYLWQHWGSKRTLLWSLPVFGPLPWMLRLVQNGLYHRMLLYLWGLGLAVALALVLYRDLESSHASQAP